MTTRIAIDAGHGGQDRGATFDGVDEADIVLHVVYYLEALLKKRGYLPFLTRSLNVFVGLGDRVKMANMFPADIFISLHCNADPDPDAPDDPQAKGEEIWIYPGGHKSHLLAESLKVYVDKIFPAHRLRGIREANFYVLKRTAMPAVLIEFGFIDNRTEVVSLAHPATAGRIAGLLADGIERYITAANAEQRGVV